MGSGKKTNSCKRKNLLKKRFQERLKTTDRLQNSAYPNGHSKTGYCREKAAQKQEAGETKELRIL